MAITITGKITGTGKSIVPPTSTSSGGSRGVLGGGTDGSNMASMEYFDISSLGNSITFGTLTVARTSITAAANVIRGFWAGGSTSSTVGKDTIDWVTISTTGDATDFGDLTRERMRSAAVSNGTNDRGIIAAGGYPTAVDTMDYITISSSGNASIFGGSILVRGIRDFLDGVSNGINERGMFVGGRGESGAHTDFIEYINIDTAGVSQGWGDLTGVKRMVGAVSNDTNDKAVFAGGWSGTSTISVIDWRSFTSGSNAANFGNLSTGRYGFGSASNGVEERGVMCGGYTTTYVSTMLYITIDSNGDASPFGDLLANRHESEAVSNGQA